MPVGTAPSPPCGGAVPRGFHRFSKAGTRMFGIMQGVGHGSRTGRAVGGRLAVAVLTFRRFSPGPTPVGAANKCKPATGADLTRCDLAAGTSPGLNLRVVNFTSANLTGANLTGATLTGAVFTKATLTNAKLTKAVLTSVISKDVVGTPASLPTNWHLMGGGYLVGPGANLQGANLKSKSMVGFNLSRAESSPTPRSTRPISPNANLNQAHLNGAVFSETKLTNVLSGGIIGTPASMTLNWRLVKGYLIGPGANLTNANLTGFALTNANFVSAKLQGAKLFGANLIGVTSGRITGTPASLPTNWKAREGISGRSRRQPRRAPTCATPCSRTRASPTRSSGPRCSWARRSTAS